MQAPHLHVVSVGPGATIQDGGRFGLRRYGVTPAGPMDWPPSHRQSGARQCARCRGTRNRPGRYRTRQRELGPARRRFLRRRDFPGFATASSLAPRRGWFWPPAAIWPHGPASPGIFTYLAVAGGSARPSNSAAGRPTRARDRGLNGGLLREGDRLPLATDAEPRSRRGDDRRPVAAARFRRAVAGRCRPARRLFRPAALDLFFSAPFKVTAGDRMAYRLDGPAIAHSRGYNIVSDGVALGAIQISGDKKPLVLMADHPPTVAIPKLGHIARADIGRLAQLRPGRTCHFAQVSAETARQALLALEDAVATAPSFCRPLRRIAALIDLSSPGPLALAGRRQP